MIVIHLRGVACYVMILVVVKLLIPCIKLRSRCILHT